MAPPFRAAKKWMTKRVIPDYTDQLDLFSEASLEEPSAAASSPIPGSGGAPGFRSRAFQQQLDFGPWKPLSPVEDVGAPMAKPTSPSSIDHIAIPPPAAREIKIGQQEERAANTGGAITRASHAETFLDIEVEERPSRDFRITAAHRIGVGGLHEKARDNIVAMRSPCSDAMSDGAVCRMSSESIRPRSGKAPRQQ